MTDTQHNNDSFALMDDSDGMTSALCHQTLEMSFIPPLRGMSSTTMSLWCLEVLHEYFHRTDPPTLALHVSHIVCGAELTTRPSQGV